MLINTSIMDGIISHDEFLEILKEKKEYNGLKNEDKTENVLKKRLTFYQKLL